MKLFRKHPALRLLLALVLLLLVGYGGFRLFSSIFLTPTDLLIQEFPSSDLRFKAAVLERDSKVTGLWTYRVRIVPAATDLGLDRGYPSSAHPTATWLGNTALSIRVPDPKNFTGVENDCREVSCTLVQ